MRYTMEYVRHDINLSHRIHYITIKDANHMQRATPFVASPHRIPAIALSILYTDKLNWVQRT